MSLPALLPTGFLPPGGHAATLDEVIDRFGTATPRRQVLGERLEALLRAAQATGKLQRAFLWGSVVSDAPFPRDVDVFLLMQAGFEQEFAHELARLRFEADVFWATEAIGTEELLAWLRCVSTLTRDDSTRDCGGPVV